MSAPTPREIVEFARTTLGFAGDDVTFLPPGPWLTAIQGYLRRWKDAGELNWLVRPHMGEQKLGLVRCKDCKIDVQLGPGKGASPQDGLGTLDALVDHLSSDKHDDASFDRKLETFGLVETRPSPKASSSVPAAGASNPNKRPSHVLDSDDERKPDVKPYIAPASSYKPALVKPNETPRERYDRLADDLETLEIDLAMLLSGGEASAREEANLKAEIRGKQLELEGARIAMLAPIRAPIPQTDIKPRFPPAVLNKGKQREDVKPDLKPKIAKPVYSPPKAAKKRRIDDSSDEEGGAPGLDTEGGIEKFLERVAGQPGEATVDEARRVLGADDKDRVGSMRTGLKPHQLLGVSWMLAQEKGEHSGGILADQMGLGKTMQAIATIVLNPSDDPDKSQTLVLAPVAVLDQWRDEIEVHCAKRAFKIIKHHGTDKVKKLKHMKGASPLFILTADGSRIRYRHHFKKKPRSTEYERIAKDGPLLRNEWYRVICDEAHTFRNKSTRLAGAISRIDAEHKWALTGTPVVNGLEDLYPLLVLLNADPWSEWKRFRTHVCQRAKKNPTQATERAQIILKPLMLRRTKQSTLDGKPLIVLPSKTINTPALDFSREERELYGAIEAGIQAKVSKFLRAGTLMQNSGHAFVLLLRLRQAVIHPALCQKDAEEAARDLGDPNAEDPLERAQRVLSEDELANVRQRVLERAVERVKAEREDPDQELTPDCPICTEPDALDISITGPCGHMFCKIDLDAWLDKEVANPSCPTCRTAITAERCFPISAFEDKEFDIELAKATGATEEELEEIERESAAKHDVDPESAVGLKLSTPLTLPSRKMLATWDLLEEWSQGEENEHDKCLIISSFTSALDLFEKFLEEKGIDCVKYDGRMSSDDRYDSIQRFMKKKKYRGESEASMALADPPVMLLSLKAGGVGLNLTAAHHVISLDLAWSPAVQDQAFERVHRLGQEHPVVIERLTIVNTVEERLLDIQRRKGMLADGCLGEGAGRKIPKLTVRELAALFGLDVRGKKIPNANGA